MKDAIVVASGRIDGYATVVAAMETRLHRRQHGRGGREKITRGIERAMATRTPMIIVSSSGGARMMKRASR